jgi:toxin ParE1/3/4
LQKHRSLAVLGTTWRENLRSFPVGSYVIFYIPVSDGVEVVRVMSGRQDIEADDMS